MPTTMPSPQVFSQDLDADGDEDEAAGCSAAVSAAVSGASRPRRNDPLSWRAGCPPHSRRGRRRYEPSAICPEPVEGPRICAHL